ncbi:SSU ribosomal protein S12P methylthiotransferase [Stackebrandtia albiflava]|uniref:Ribosomal protein uS12 methylthiotransferase RimO n=1 Tax=Stackebrandtia albiflava TaxID=406432 RepID=A0A562VGX0_9ACTN|nr:30S ribosomal protein S12 methylthiotransferase RimO [Stackebrandtia albiflava]TWJ17146.1 SSU ribosomal protein S12P methylthiotransferase [Stackebrandtia albiflava]
MSEAPTSLPKRRVAVLTLGCARNEVDSEELAARLAHGGWEVTDDGEAADVVMVNTCGFIETAKQDSIDTLLAAADTGAKVVATGCLAERYGTQLADSLPEADAVLGFDHYPDIAARLDAVARGENITSHTPQDRRKLLPISPAARKPSAAVIPGHAAAPAESTEGLPAHLTVMRRRLSTGPVANVKIASGCDRRCAFCAIPTFRGAFVSRPPEEIIAEVRWLATQGVREITLVSENTTSYGKDLSDPSALERLTRELAAVDGIVRVRLSYLQPAELRPALIETIATTPGVAPYFDLSFQHSSRDLLRRMRRFGSTEGFLDLLDTVRGLAPQAGARTNVIVGFPGETETDVAELERFLTHARLDAIGVFAYSDEEGTEGAELDGHVDPDVITARYEHFSSLADELCDQRAAERIGETVTVLIDTVDDDGVDGRAAHQAPEVDGSTAVIGDVDGLTPGDLVTATVVDSNGVDLVAELVSVEGR